MKFWGWGWGCWGGYWSRQICSTSWRVWEYPILGLQKAMSLVRVVYCHEERHVAGRRSCEATAWGVAHASRNPNAKWEHLTAGSSASFDHFDMQLHRRKWMQWWLWHLPYLLFLSDRLSIAISSSIRELSSFKLKFNHFCGIGLHWLNFKKVLDFGVSTIEVTILKSKISESKSNLSLSNIFFFDRTDHKSHYLPSMLPLSSLNVLLTSEV